MTPDVQAARLAALAALGLPTDTPASWGDPAARDLRVPLPDGWRAFSRDVTTVPRDPDPRRVFPRMVQAAPVALLIVQTMPQRPMRGPGRPPTPLIVPWRVLTHRLVNVIDPARVVDPITPEQLAAVLELSGAFSAAVEASRVGGWDAAAQVLRAVCGVGL